MGAIRASDHALGSIPVCLASAASHSALVNLGLCMVNTPLQCHDTINTSHSGTLGQIIEVYNGSNLKTEPPYSGCAPVSHAKTHNTSHEMSAQLNLKSYCLIYCKNDFWLTLYNCISLTLGSLYIFPGWYKWINSLIICFTLRDHVWLFLCLWKLALYSVMDFKLHLLSFHQWQKMISYLTTSVQRTSWANVTQSHVCWEAIMFSLFLG